jgi:uncharacterized protein (DUF58 family)
VKASWRKRAILYPLIAVLILFQALRHGWVYALSFTAILALMVAVIVAVVHFIARRSPSDPRD